MQTKTCPHCAEAVKQSAVKCRYCGYLFPAIRLAKAKPHMSIGARVALIVAAPVVFFAILAVVSEIIDGFGSEQTYARSIGLSISECVEASKRLGEKAAEADQICNRRVPKKPLDKK